MSPENEAQSNRGRLIPKAKCATARRPSPKVVLNKCQQLPALLAAMLSMTLGLVIIGRAKATKSIVTRRTSAPAQVPPFKNWIRHLRMQGRGLLFSSRGSSETRWRVSIRGTMKITSPRSIHSFASGTGNDVLVVIGLLLPTPPTQSSQHFRWLLAFFQSKPMLKPLLCAPPQPSVIRKHRTAPDFEIITHQKFLQKRQSSCLGRRGRIESA